MASAVYLLCGLTSIACAVLLFRQYRLTRGALLFWSTWCFVCFALTNILLFLDLVVFPGVDLSVLRSSINLAGMMMLLFGMVRETT
jgi:hypothetical protein